MHYPRTVRNIRILYLVGLTLIALLVTSSFLTMKRVVSQQRGYSSLVNLAGHQAGLSNRIAYFVSLMAITDDEYEFIMARAQVGRTVNKMRSAHEVLRNGDPEKGIPYVTNANLAIIYEDPTVGLDRALERFLERAEETYASDMRDLDTGSASYIYVTTYGPHVLEPMLDAAVDEYAKIGSRAIYRIERLELLIWLATLGALLLELVLIFRPLEKQVRRAIKSLQASIAELTSTRKRLLAAQRLAKIGDWELRTKNGALTWSDQLYAICGVSPETFSVSRESYLQLVHPDDRANVEAALGLRGSKPSTASIEYRIHRPDGSQRIVFQRASTVTDSDRQVVKLAGTIQDITDRKNDEKEKEKLEARLAQANKMEAIGTLAGGVAHDLNNVLSGIVSYPDLIMMQLPEDSHLVKPISTIKASGEKAAAIVQDLLTLARRGVAAKRVVNLNTLVSQYLKSPEYEKLRSFHPGVTLAVDLEENLLNIEGSPIHLFKTAMNLVSNAAEAMPDGGTITVSTENVYRDHPLPGFPDSRDKEYVVLSVSDTGVGISAEEKKRIFEPFYTKKVMGRSGTGLGMAVVWGTVKDHDAHIDLRSRVGLGTTFDLYFPAVRRSIAAEAEQPRLEDYRGRGESVLVVDDLESQRSIAVAMLSELGYAAKAVSTGGEAVDFVRRQDVDLLILDMIMVPGMDGLETYQKIKAIRPQQKAIIASGFSETDRVKEAQRLGAGQYLKKPYTLEKIGMAVKAELAA